MREAPGHGKDKADGHGGTLKRFLRAWMRRHGSTTIDAKTLIESASFDAAGNALSLTSQLVWPRVAAARAATSRGCSGARCGRVCVCCAKLELWQMCRAEWCAMAAGGVSLARAECARRCRVRTRVRERRTVARVASRCRVRRVTREEA